jgi:hypothetical protein
MDKVIASVILGFLASLCACSPILGKSAGVGIIYTDVQFNEEITDNPLGSKRGEGCAMGILGVFVSGDASAAAAARQAGITKISTVDGSGGSILGFVYNTYCVVVTGE